MAQEKFPVTPAVRVLRSAGVAFVGHLYTYEHRGGTAHSSRALGVDEHQVIKTLVLEDQDKRPLIALMHGDREVSTRGLARALGLRSVTPCEPSVATRHTGYEVGGTSPFGTRKQLPVYVQPSVLELELIYINGGKRGFLVEIQPSELVRVLRATPVEMSAGGGD
ncbi:MAG TPA: Cys-tRNA(Pro) deacylase [Polyangiaceae bacterium]|nr:Cys-tRNA(Pro) deacylase [Polyangiaceae bacterium]